MAVPTQRKSKRRSRTRASHHAIQPRMLTACSRCATMRPPHFVCPKCGYYAGREVVAKEE